MHGDQDKIVREEQTKEMAEALRRVRAEVKLIVLPGARHQAQLFELKPVWQFFDRHLRSLSLGLVGQTRDWYDSVTQGMPFYCRVFITTFDHSSIGGARVNVKQSFSGRRSMGFLCGVVLLLAMIFPAQAAKQGPIHVSVKGFHQRVIYHSPQTPGFTCWAQLEMMPDKSLMLSFTQATGPVTVYDKQGKSISNWRPTAPQAVLRRLDWPPPGTSEPGYDMTGLNIECIHMRSVDEGKTWTRVSSEPFQSCMNTTEEGEVALSDGTILRTVWGQYLPYWNVPQTGFLQRSTDDSKSWGPPELITSDKSLRLWPKRLRVLADGRIVITGAAGSFTHDHLRRWWVDKLRPCLFVSKDKLGKSWSGPLYLMPEKPGLWPTEEFDVAELPNGDLLAVYRVTVDANPPASWGKGARMESILVKKGDTWEPGAVTDAPFRPSGHPELLTTKEGLILHIATTGTWWTTDRGAHWTKLNLAGTPYYPRSVQLPDGTIMVVGHRGGDDPYGKTDQSIVMQTYRLDVKR